MTAKRIIKRDIEKSLAYLSSVYPVITIYARELHGLS
jgi:hypothetical protein